MDRYQFDDHAIHEHCEWNRDGNWCKYSDVVALEAQLQQAQNHIKVIESDLEDSRGAQILSVSTIREIQRKMAQLEAENGALRADCAEYQEGLQRSADKLRESEIDNSKLGDFIGLYRAILLDHMIGKCDDSYLQSAIDSAGRLLSQCHPGDSLLKELEALRAVRDAAEGLYYMVTNFGDFRNGNTHNGIDEGEVMAGKVIARFGQALAAAKETEASDTPEPCKCYQCPKLIAESDGAGGGTFKCTDHPGIVIGEWGHWADDNNPTPICKAGGSND